MSVTADETEVGVPKPKRRRSSQEIGESPDCAGVGFGPEVQLRAWVSSAMAALYERFRPANPVCLKESAGVLKFSIRTRESLEKNLEKTLEKRGGVA